MGAKSTILITILVAVDSSLVEYYTLQDFGELLSLQSWNRNLLT